MRYTLSMADPTLADVMAAISALRSDVTTVKLQNTQQTGLLTSLIAGVQLMATTADDTKTAVDALDAKVDTLIGLVQPSIQTLRDQLAAAQSLVAQLQAGDAAAGVTLTSTIAAAQAEAAKVDAAIATLTPPPATP